MRPAVEAVVKECKNVFVTCSKSGKMSNQLMKEWVENCWKPVVDSCPQKPLILLDSWSGHKGDDNFVAVQDKMIKKILPPGSTSQVQPCDVKYFQPHKYLTRALENSLIATCPEFQVRDRLNFIKIHSTIFRQLKHGGFQQMFRYGWHECGYLDDKYAFKNVRQKILENLSSNCSFPGCKRRVFGRCAICKEPSKEFCGLHFIAHNLFHASLDDDKIFAEHTSEDLEPFNYDDYELQANDDVYMPEVIITEPDVEVIDPDAMLSNPQEEEQQESQDMFQNLMAPDCGSSPEIFETTPPVASVSLETAEIPETRKRARLFQDDDN